ncbi:MAG: hypothetical protein ABJO02_19015 [Reichenbachiella sp.]|uniref:hypothetical protein n=1 Tax=Reichenbachiella sp. TaxID=2184521 RepID=UPI00329A6F63
MSQHSYGINHYLTTYSGAQTTGEYMFSLNHAAGGGSDYGIGFSVTNDTKMRIWQDIIYLYENTTIYGDLKIGGDLEFDGNLSSFSMVEDGDIFNLDIIRGFDDLRFQGSPTSGTSMYINEAGHIGMGTTSDYGSKLVVVGEDNDGTQAILNLRNNGHSMLLDGNEIDATAGTLFLQNNSAHNIEALNQGGNLGLNITAPQERLHLYGNLRIDDGAIMSHGPLEFKPDVDASDDDEIVFYNNIEEETMRIHTDGNVGIGTAAPTQKLEVVGTIKATSFVTSTASFPDYVFSSSYKKLSLNNLDQYIQANKHLPNMPAEAEVVANGLDVADVVIKSVENIETIYLHLIEMNKKLDQLQQENAALKAQLNK